MIVYGGASFVAALIDEFHLFVNLTALGEGLAIFDQINIKQKLTLVKVIPFECGIVLLHYNL
jgi:dihydrofolate reductase